MPPFGPRKPKLTLPEPSTPSIEIIANRKTMFADWLDNCEKIQDAFVEGLLANLTSRDG